MIHEVGVQIGERIGRVIIVQVDDRVIGWGKFLSIRVEMNIAKALIRGMFLTLEGKKTWVPIKYGCLPTFCFRCGVVKHPKQGCSLCPLGSNKMQYGAWLRAPVVKERDNTNKKYREEEMQHTTKEQPWRQGREDRDEGPKGNPESRADIHESDLIDVNKATTFLSFEILSSPRTSAGPTKELFKESLSQPVWDSSEQPLHVGDACLMQGIEVPVCPTVNDCKGKGKKSTLGPMCNMDLRA